MPNASTITLNNTSEWASRLNFQRPLALGTFNEPAITSANTVMQTILGAPFRWRWNRVISGYYTVAGQQDYTLFNWSAVANVGEGWLTIDDQGNCQQATTKGVTGSAQPSWAHAAGTQTSDGSVTWTNVGPLSPGASQTYRFGWIEGASVQDTNKKWIAMSSKVHLDLETNPGRPAYISAQADDGNGNITFRMSPIPIASAPVLLTIQQKPIPISSLTQTWAPIPDELSKIYNWGFLALMWLFADDPRYATANQKFVSQLLATSEGIDETQRNIFLENWQFVTGDPMSNQMRLQQGTSMRGV